MTKRRTEISVGSTFGSWVTLTDTKPFDSTHERAWVRVQCVCGTIREVSPSTLTSGSSKSCGCRSLAQRVPKQVPIGMVFGRLTTVSPVQSSDEQHSRPWVNARCECGTVCDVGIGNLKAGNSTSCGCVHRKSVSTTFTTHGATKGYRKHRLYRIWRGMRERCYNQKARNYKWYGAKGVQVCSAWRDDFLVFRTWALQAGYTDGLELDRKHSDDNYEPDSCRWVTKKQNLRNRDLIWDDDVDARLVAYAASQKVSPYEIIKLAVEKFIAEV